MGIKYFKKIICMVLIATLLINAMPTEVFAQLLTDEMRREMEISAHQETKMLNEILEEQAKAMAEAEKARQESYGSVEGLCKKLLLCIAFEGKEGEWKEPSISLLYLDDGSIEAEVKRELGEEAELDVEKVNAERNKERKELKEIKAAARRLKGEGKVKGGDLVRYYKSLIPAIYLADVSDENFRVKMELDYGLYLQEQAYFIKKERALGKLLSSKDIGDRDAQEEVLGLGEILLGYSIIKKEISGEGVEYEIGKAAAETGISPLVVPMYIEILLENGRYDVLTRYLKELGVREKKTDWIPNTYFGEYMDLFVVSPYVKKSSWGYKTQYAEGVISKNGYYVGEGGETRNIWEDLPSVIAGYGKEGEKVINDIFYNGIDFAAPTTGESMFLPEVYWEDGKILPFIIGSLKTNKVKASVNLEGSLANKAEYYGNADVVGLVEISLLSYYFYDVPDYKYYKRVHEELAAKYWRYINVAEQWSKEYEEYRKGGAYISNATKAEFDKVVKGEIGIRHFEVYKPMWKLQDPKIVAESGKFIGGIYNSTNNTGVLLRHSERSWTSGRENLNDILKVTKWVDIALMLYYTFKLGVSIIGLVKMMKNASKLIQLARVARVKGMDGSLREIAVSIRRGGEGYGKLFGKMPREMEMALAKNDIKALDFRGMSKGDIKALEGGAISGSGVNGAGVGRGNVGGSGANGIKVPTLESQGIVVEGKPEPVIDLNAKVKVKVDVETGKVSVESKPNTAPAGGTEPVLPKDWLLLGPGDRFNESTGQLFRGGLTYRYDINKGWVVESRRPTTLSGVTGEGAGGSAQFGRDGLEGFRKMTEKPFRGARNWERLNGEYLYNRYTGELFNQKRSMLVTKDGLRFEVNAEGELNLIKGRSRPSKGMRNRAWYEQQLIDKYWEQNRIWEEAHQYKPMSTETRLRLEAERAKRYHEMGWLKRKWKILNGDLTFLPKDATSFDLRLSKFVKNHPTTMFFLKHPVYTMSVVSPFGASTASVMHTPMMPKGSTEIVYNMPSGGITSGMSGTVGNMPKTPNLNIGKGFVQPNYGGFRPTTFSVASPFSGFISIPRYPTLFDTPFVAVRKTSDAGGGALADDGQVPTAQEPKVTQSEPKEEEGEATVGQQKEEEVIQVNDPPKEKTNIFSLVLPNGLRPGETLADRQRRLEIRRQFRNAAAAIIGGLVLTNSFMRPMIGNADIGNVPLQTATILTGFSGLGLNNGNLRNGINDFWYNHVVLKDNLKRILHIQKHMPALNFEAVDIKGSESVQVESNFGFVSQSEYENYYTNNIEDADQAKARFDRKVAHDNMLAELIFKTLSSPTEKQLIWIMASAADDAFKILAAQLIKELGYAGTNNVEIANYFRSIFNTVKINLPQLSEDDIARLQALTRRNVEKAENLLDVASPEDPILTGAIVDLDILKKEMSDRAIDALYNDSDLTKDILEPLIQTQRNDFSTTYKNILPIYLQYNDGTLSKKPKIYIILSEEITVPDGFVVAQDESTAYKFVVSDILAINKSNSSSRSPFKNPKKMHNLSAKDRQLLIETSLSSEDKSYIAASVQKADLTNTDQDDLFALIKALPKDRLDWALTAISLVAGADLAASLSSQFKKLIPIYGAMLAVAGFGYFSPKIANWFKNKINKWGNVKTAEIGLYAMLAASAIGITAGMWGNYKPDEAGAYGIAASVIFFTVAATVASIFNTIKGPMLKNVYTDDTIFSSKNMNFDTIKALAKVIVAGIPAIFAIPEIITSMMNQGAEEAATGWISHLPNINWSIMVPVTALISLWGLYSIYHSRLKTEIKKEDTAKSTVQEDPNISAEDKAKAEADKKIEEENFKKDVINKFNNIIKPLIKPEYRRLFMIYLPYGIVQSIIIGQIAGITLNKAALFVTLTGSLVSWLVRKGSTKLIKEGKINEDQLTGFMLPLMAASYIGLFLSPFYLTLPPTTESIPLLLSILGAYISTPALGTVENTRMLNKTVDYYDKERAKIEENTDLTPEEKKAAIDKLNKEMAAMKTQTSTHYNNGNASALYPIIGMALAAMMLLDFFPNSTVSQALPEIADILGGVTDTVDPKDLLKLSFFKVFLSLAAGLATATFISNMGLTKSIVSSNKVKISQEMIDSGKVTAEALKINVNDMQATIIELNKEIEALNTDLTLNRIRQSSEETANKWLQKAISINNRLKFLSEYDADVAAKLESTIETFKNSVMPNLKYIVEEVSPINNNFLAEEKVSDYSLQFLFQYNELIASVNASEFNYIEEGIKTPIKEIHFVKALTYRDGLISLLKKKQDGNTYNAMFKDVQDLYDKALNEITLYEKDNNLTEWQDERIIALKKQLNSIRREFLQNN